MPSTADRPAGGRVDSHQHFWRYDATAYPWIGAGMQVLARDWLPGDLRPRLDAGGFGRCIAVQARDSVEETGFLLDLADAHPWIAAVVGWVDLRSSDLGRELARWNGRAALKGIRHLLQDEPGPQRWMADAAVRRNVAELQRRGLVYDVLVHARQLDGVADFCAALDAHTLVLDHLAKPAIRERSAAARAAWRAALQPVAALPHVVCKLSGLVTEAHWRDGRLQDHPAEDFHPYLDTALELFGPQRLMFGSDWPVCLLAASHAGVCGLIDGWARQRLSADEQAALWGGTAARCYGLD